MALLTLAASLAACKSERGKPRARTSATHADAGARGAHPVRIPSNEPRYLNPLIEPRFVVANALLFEGLVAFDAKLQPVPALAESWKVSDDRRTLTFTLRAGVLWHDGTPFTSADVAFTYQTIRATPAAASWQSYMSAVESLTTPDDRTVVVTYVAPFAPALASWSVAILPRHAYVVAGATGGDAGALDLAASKARIEPIGTGPYKFGRWSPGQSMTLEVNSRWWHGPVSLGPIELVFGTADSDVIAALRRGDVDIARVGDVDAWLEATQQPGFLDELETSEVVEPRIRLIAWNTQRPTLTDKRVRKALTMALDRPRVIADVLLGQAQAISAPLFPTMFGYDSSVAPLPFDPAGARKVLDAAAPVRAGKRFNLEVIAVDSLAGAGTDRMAAIFAKDLAALGITFELTVLPRKEYYDRIERRDYDGVYFGWLPDLSDPDPAALLHSSQAAAGANYAAYSNPAVDKLVEDARTTLDRDARKKLYEQLQRLLIDELPYTPLYAPFGHYAWNRRLRGVNPRDVAPLATVPGIAGWSLAGG